MELYKVALLGITGVLFGIWFRESKQEYGYYIGFAVCLMIFTYGINKLFQLLEYVDEFNKLLGNNRYYINIFLKVVGVTYVCEFCANVCKDAGYSAVAGQVEVFGKLTVLLSGFPILLALIQTISELIE